MQKVYFSLISLLSTCELCVFIDGGTDPESLIELRGPNLFLLPEYSPLMPLLEQTESAHLTSVYAVHVSELHSRNQLFLLPAITARNWRLALGYVMENVLKELICFPGVAILIPGIRRRQILHYLKLYYDVLLLNYLLALTQRRFLVCKGSNFILLFFIFHSGNRAKLTAINLE